MHVSNRKLPDEMVEVLEATWKLEEKGEASLDSITRRAAVMNQETLQAMQEQQLIEIDSSNRVLLLPRGRDLAKQIVRRHRLAERLLCDVLRMEVEDSEAPACEFEHLIAEGITDSICTLLGHPRYCPHNCPIPQGECCRQARDELHPIVVPCHQLGLGESARIAYLCLREHNLLAKLSSLGITPGAPLKLLQKWPSYVVQCDETEIALEEGVVRNIYVWQAQGASR